MEEQTLIAEIDDLVEEIEDKLRPSVERLADQAGLSEEEIWSRTGEELKARNK